MRTLRLRSIVVALALLLGSGAGLAASSVSWNNGEVEHDGYPAQAQAVAQALNEAWGPLRDFWVPLGMSDFGPITVELDPTLVGPAGEPAKGYSYPGGNRIVINPVHADFLPGATAAHELFHVLTLRAGSTIEQIDDDAWLLGGIAEMAEHLVWPNGPHKISRMAEYLIYDSRHHASLLDVGHYSQLFMYYLHQTRRPSR